MKNPIVEKNDASYPISDTTHSDTTHNPLLRRLLHQSKELLIIVILKAVPFRQYKNRMSVQYRFFRRLTLDKKFVRYFNVVCLEFDDGVWGGSKLLRNYGENQEWNLC